MKRFFVMALILILTGSFVSLSAQQTLTRFAVVDMEQIIAAYPENSRPSREQIISVISRAAQREVYSMVLDRNVPGIIWLSPAVRLDDIDITERVVAMIRSRPFTPTNNPTTITNFAFVDMSRLSSDIASRLDAVRNYNQNEERLQAELNSQFTELREIIASIAEAQEEGRRPREIRDLENQRDDKIREIAQFRAASEAELERERRRIAELDTQLRPFGNAVRPVAESMGITMVMARNSPGILWIASNVNVNRFDITGRVIEQISSGGR